MPWTETTRAQYRRDGLRYSSDLTDAEWAVIAPFLPEPNRIGRPRTTNMREVVNAILYLAAAGSQWRLLPKEFPPNSTVQNYFYLWRDDGTWGKRVVRTADNFLAVLSFRQRRRYLDFSRWPNSKAGTHRPD